MFTRYFLPSFSLLVSLLLLLNSVSYTDSQLKYIVHGPTFGKYLVPDEKLLCFLAHVVQFLSGNR